MPLVARRPPSRVLAPCWASDERSPVVCRPSTFPCFLRGVGGGLLSGMARVILLLDVYELLSAAAFSTGRMKM